jgi:uncharacterized protein (DUF3084 family)
VQPDTATLLAVLAAPLAVLAAVLGIVVVLGIRRVRRQLTGTADRIRSQEAAIGAELRAIRIAADAATVLLTRVREEADRLDTGAADLTTTLRDARQGLDRLTTGRVGPMVRAMQLASALARIALLWRAPVR